MNDSLTFDELKVRREALLTKTQWKRCKSFVRVVQRLCRSGIA